MLLRTTCIFVGFLFAMSASAQTELPSTGEMLFQVFGALLFIIFLILGAAWLTKRFNLMHNVQGKDLNVLSSLSLGKKEKLVLVNACGKKLLLGVSANGVNFLQDLSGHDIALNQLHASAQNEIHRNAQDNTEFDTHPNSLHSGAAPLDGCQHSEINRSEKPDFSSFLKNIIAANNRENKV